jgi:tripartite-type tricarboxylate transporter receptor subunit TctC
MKSMSCMLMAAALLGTGFAHAQAFPEKPVRWIVPWPPGGGADVLSRMLSGRLAEVLGQPVVIENRGGAAGNIGAEIAARAPADGYTIAFAFSGTHSINPHIYSKMPFRDSDFAPVIWLSMVPQVLVVNPSIPAKTVKELIALARARPGELTFGSSGNGAINHLTGELFNLRAGTKILHVPYKGGGPAAVALITGEISMIFGEPASVVQQVKAGKLRAIAVTSAARARALPDLPTMREAGIADYDVTSWNGVLAPAATPREIINRLNADFNRIITAPDMQARMLEFGFEAMGGPPERFSTLIKEELAKWAPVIKAAGVRID